MDAVDRNKGYNMLHQWAKLNQVWPFDFLLKGDFPGARTKVFTDLITKKTKKKNWYDTPLHTAARTHKNVEITKSIINGYKLEQVMRAGSMVESTDTSPPWRIGNRYKHTPLLVAIYEQQNEELALYYINLDSTLLHMLSDSGESPLFAAVGDLCANVVEEILNNQEVSFNMLRKTKGNTVLHSLWKMPENIGTKLFQRYWWMINLRDADGKTAGETALQVAIKDHKQWLISLIKNYHHSKNLEPFDWVKACEKDETTWAVLAFIDSCPNLREICLEKNDTPLHHIKLQNYQDYVNLLNNPSIAELKNTRDSKGATPLHRALERMDIHLATALLRDEGVERNIQDFQSRTAMSMLTQLCKDRDWELMCFDLNINPHLKLSFVHHDMNLDPMRSALFIVAALLATITFAAGFTLPGGVDDKTGIANLATKAPFIVFLLADAYALCSSMLVLFGLIWSMASNRPMAYLLVDRSIFILITSLYGTILAFMTGIYTVLPKKSLWVAIIVFIICSFLVVFAIRTLLDRVLSKLVPAAANQFQVDRIRWIEEGKPSLSRIRSAIPQYTTSSLAKENITNAENREMVPLLEEGQGQASTSGKDDIKNPPSPPYKNKGISIA
uniref:PGG domain-containing protein n=2 Tax=Chenopodium quinoa TaxID=63459 RepID=A0A803MVP1_CHEQI